MKQSIVIFILGLIWIPAIGQNFLEMPVTLQHTNSKLTRVFQDLETQLAFNFSYEAQLINESKRVDIHIINSPLRKALTAVLGESYEYKVVGTHVIVQSKLPPINKRGESFSFSGQVLDANNQPLENAIVYEANRQTAVVTNFDGYYRFNFQDKNHPLALNISRNGYRDTVIHISQKDLQQERGFPLPEQRILPSNFTVMEPQKGSILSSSDVKTLSEIQLVKFMVPDDALYVSGNLNAFNWQTAQISLLPYFGTNDLLNGLTTNNVSVNVIGGYTAQIEGVEFGAVSNFIQNSVYGFQAAGVSNIVGKDVVGFQAAGVVNLTLGDVKGGQASGVVNHVKGKHTGVMAAGVVNITEGISKNDTIKGLKTQLSGVTNIHLKDTSNIQIAGVWNQAEQVKGIQISGLYNYTKKLNGLQIGIVNIADTIETGLPVGLINVVKTGYRKLEISSNELFYGNVAFKTGGNHIYSYLSIGFGEYLGAALGFGYTSNYHKKTSFNIDLSGIATFDPNANTNSYMGTIYRLQPAFNYRISNKLTLSTGPAFNFFMLNKETGSSPPDKLIKPSDIYYGSYYLNKSITSLKNKHWLGWHMSVRF